MLKQVEAKSKLGNSNENLGNHHVHIFQQVCEIVNKKFKISAIRCFNCGSFVLNKKQMNIFIK